MTTYKIKKKFLNYYLKRADEIVLRYKAFKGFNTIQEAETAIDHLGHSPDYYVFVNFKEKYYAAYMEGTDKQVVVGEDMIYYRYKDEIHYVSRNEINKLPFKIKKPRIDQEWINVSTNDLEEIQGKPLKVTRGRLAGNRQLVRNTANLVGIAFYDTMVPVYQLNVFDVYFEHPPSRLNLWEEGVRAYNPFTNEKDYAEEQPYTIDHFQVEHIN